MADERAEHWDRVGLRVLQSRKSKGWSQGELANAAGVSDRTVGTLERGGRISLSNLRLIGLALGWPNYISEGLLTAEEREPSDAERRAMEAMGVYSGVDNPVLHAIAADPQLLPEAKEHLIKQYGLLRRVSPIVDVMHMTDSITVELEPEADLPRAARRGKTKKALKQDEQPL